MRTKILSTFLLLGIVFSANSQEISKNAIGLRLGDNDGFGVEASYQRKLSEKNRLELDLGIRDRSNYYGNSYGQKSVKLTGLYQWVWNIEGNFNWYAGVGGGLGNSRYDYKDNGQRYNESYTYAFVAGDIGVEYLFDFPLQVFIDFRPEFYFTDKVKDDFGPDIAIGARYRF